MNDKLETDKIDVIVSAAKSVVGIIPIAGPLLSELVQNLIPNQRMDRLVRYISELEEKLNKFDQGYIEEILKEKEAVGLFEESFVRASRATSDERLKYIANLIESGISEERIGFIESQYLLSLLGELNDIEIIWLRFFLHPEMGGDVEFRQKYENILEPVAACIGDSEEVINKESIQKSYIEHLERLELIKSHIRTDRKTGLPEFDSSTGKPKVAYRSITTLGRLLLKHIGFDTNNDG